MSNSQLNKLKAGIKNGTEVTSNDSRHLEPLLKAGFSFMKNVWVH